MAVLPQSLHDDEVLVETREVSPSHFLFKIESFSLLSENNVKMYKTTVFEAGDYKWRLIIYPNGQESGNEGDHVSVYVAIADSTSLLARWEINAVFGIFLLNQKTDSFLCMRGKARRFHAVSTCWGFQKFISKKTLMDPSSGFLVNDNCVFGAEVFVLKSQGVIERLSLSKAKTPIKRTFRISKFSKLPDIWVNRSIYAGELYWKLEIYTRGENAVKDHSISLYLGLVDLKHPCQKLHVSFKVQINDQINGNHCTKTCTNWFDATSLWGWREFMSIEDLKDPVKGFLVNDCCVAEIEISVLAVASVSS